jgi:hypothetical protein
LFTLTRQQLDDDDDDDDDDDEIPLDALMKTAAAAAAAVPRGGGGGGKVLRVAQVDDTDVDVSSMFIAVCVICVQRGDKKFRIRYGQKRKRREYLTHRSATRVFDTHSSSFLSSGSRVV